MNPVYPPKLNCHAYLLANEDKRTLNEGDESSCASTDLAEGVGDTFGGASNCWSSGGRGSGKTLRCLGLEVGGSLRSLLGGLRRSLLGLRLCGLSATSDTGCELGGLPENGAGGDHDHCEE